MLNLVVSCGVIVTNCNVMREKEREHGRLDSVSISDDPASYAMCIQVHHLWDILIYIKGSREIDEWFSRLFYKDVLI